MNWYNPSFTPLFMVFNNLYYVTVNDYTCFNPIFYNASNRNSLYFSSRGLRLPFISHKDLLTPYPQWKQIHVNSRLCKECGEKRIMLKLNKWICISYRYSAPHPFTKLILMVHILVSWYTASNPWFTDWASRAANSWLLKIFRLQPRMDKSKIIIIIV